MPLPAAPSSLMLSRALLGLDVADPVGAAWLLREVERRFFAVQAPLHLGHYRLLRPIGAGGFGVVYAAHDPRLDRRVAIKLLHPEHAAARPELLLREAQAMARLSHPNVLTVHDVGTYDLDTGARGGLFVVTEFIDGETLQDWLTAAPRRWPEIVETFAPAGRGLAAAHAIGLVHRDFKPGNVLIGRDGGVRVADFGLARWSDADEPGRGEPGRPGTPAYMAPELFATDVAPGPAADQFAFCVALFEALHAVQPFPTSGLAARLAAIEAREVAATRADAGVPDWLHAAVVRGLDPDPSRRHPGMLDLLHALDPVAASRGVGDTAAIRTRIHPIEPGVIRYHEIPLPSAFSVQVMRNELTRLTSGGRYTLLVALDEANMPGPEVRQHIIGMFADTNLAYVALVTGGDPVKELTARLIVGSVVPPARFAMFDALPEALAACRAALAG